MNADSKRPEQVALSLLLESAHQEFEHAVKSIGPRFLLWGSFDSAEVLAENYFKAKKKNRLADGRRTARSFSSDESRLKRTVGIAAAQAWEYVEWANQLDRQPILRDCLVSYCAAFEACLKNVALVFKLAKKKPRGISDQVFVPGDEFKRYLKEISDDWEKCGQDREAFRFKAFFDQFICLVNPAPDLYPFPNSPDDNLTHWQICQAAVKLRNAVVHQLGRPSEQESIGDDVFPAMWEVELKARHLKLISESMQKVISPLSIGLDKL